MIAECMIAGGLVVMIDYKIIGHVDPIKLADLKLTDFKQKLFFIINAIKVSSKRVVINIYHSIHHNIHHNIHHILVHYEKKNNKHR